MLQLYGYKEGKMEHPKPPKLKKKKALNNKRDNSLRECALCHKMRVCDTHEVFGGNNRQNSIRYGFQVPLCREQCHRLVTLNDMRALAAQLVWKRKFQRKREQDLIAAGNSPEEARKIWHYEMGKNYL